MSNDNNRRGKSDKQLMQAVGHGLQIYYEIHGVANPARPLLVLLHGGGDTIGRT
jgi:alpha-beta hydrolase superfamily lysophospholipase